LPSHFILFFYLNLSNKKYIDLVLRFGKNSARESRREIRFGPATTNSQILFLLSHFAIFRFTCRKWRRWVGKGYRRRPTS